jgi:hypothetical protein
MVGGLVKKEYVGTAEQNPGQFDAPTLTTGQGAQWLSQDPLFKPDRCGNCCCLRLHRVAAESLELGFSACVTGDYAISLNFVGLIHTHARLVHASQDFLESASGQNSIARNLIRVT